MELTSSASARRFEQSIGTPDCHADRDAAQVVNACLSPERKAHIGLKMQDPPARAAPTEHLKEKFLAMVCHELQSPLGAIRNAIRVLRAQQNPGGTLQGQMHELIERQVAQMNQLTAGLLDITRVMRNELNLQCEPIELQTVLRNAAQTLEWDLKRRNHHLTVTGPSAGVWLVADAARLEQVFVNLLGNALKYTDSAGEILLSLEYSDGYACVRIRDSGIGIAADTLPHIFNLYVQAHPKTPRPGSGLGIGLSLVRAMVEAHGGSVTAASAGLGLGSEFTVRLPLASQLAR